MARFKQRSRWRGAGGVAVCVLVVACVTGLAFALGHPDHGRQRARGGLIAFTLDRIDCCGPDARREIWVVGPGGGSARRLVYGSDPAWSPDGRTIAYLNADDELWLMRADGGARRRIVQVAPTDELIQPRWSPDGTHLLYEDCIGFNCSLEVVDTQGPASTRSLLDVPGLGIDGADWSPNGPELLYAGEPGVYAIRENGQGFHRISAGFSVGLRWAPNGNELLFIVGGADFGGAVGTMDVHGRHVEFVIRGREIQAAAWSPDGRRIAWADNWRLHPAIAIRTLGTRIDRTIHLKRDGDVTSVDWQPLGAESP